MSADENSQENSKYEDMEFAREMKRQIQEREAAALRQAKAEFARLVETETDEVRREKLKEFVPLVEDAKTLTDVQWFQQKAVQTSQAARALHEQETAKDAVRTVARRHVAMVWAVLIGLCAIVLVTGLSKVYYGVLPEGQVIEIGSQDGAMIEVDGKPTQVVYSHTGYELREGLITRSIIAIILIVLGILYTLSK